MSLIAEHNTGRRQIINGVEWPFMHTIRGYSFGYVVATDVCGYDVSLTKIEHYETKRAALQRWSELTEHGTES